MSDHHSIIADNYQAICQRIQQAATRSGRSGSDVTLVAVTKYVDLEQIRPLIDAGCRHLAESRPQALWERVPQLPEDIQWHLIGHLQRNKVARTIPIVCYMHSLDSLRLIESIGTPRAAKHRCQFLLEINISADPGKHGFSLAQLPQVFELLARHSDIPVIGLMGMSALDSSADEARAQFASLRELRDDWKGQTADHIRLDELSMGMSGDFEIAIEEGATLVRIGSALFEPTGAN